MPVTLAMLVIGMTLAVAGATSVVNAQRGTVRDQDSKIALAAADSAADLAIFRANKLLTDPGTLCMVLGAAGDLVPGVPLADGWCPAVTGTVGNATYSYRVKPPSLVGTLQNHRRIGVVATGTSDDVTRRIHLTAAAHTGEAVFGNAAVISLSDLLVFGNPQVTANIAAQQDVTLQGSAVVCGDISHGPGGAITGEGQCPGFTAFSQSLIFAPADSGAVHAGANDNSRIGTLDLAVGGVRWTSASRDLRLTGVGTLTLAGSDYSLCTLSMSGSSTLIAAAGRHVRLHFDTPERCGLPDRSEQVSVTGGAKLLSGAPLAGGLALVLAGSEDQDSVVKLAGTSAAINNVAVYAPDSRVVVEGTATYASGILGREVSINGNARVSGANANTLSTIPLLLEFQRERYVECSAKAPELLAAPDREC